MTDKAYWKSKGVCIMCHEKDAYTMAGRSLCGECARKDRERKKELYVADKETILERNRERHNYRVQHHLCVRCGIPLPDGYAKKTCEKHLKQFRIRDKIKRSQHPPRGDFGTCYMCNRNSVLPDRRCCAECYEKIKKGMLSAVFAKNEVYNV